MFEQTAVLEQRALFAEKVGGHNQKEGSPNPKQWFSWQNYQENVGFIGKKQSFCFTLFFLFFLIKNIKQCRANNTIFTLS